MLGVQQATRIASVLQRADIWAVTSLPEEQVRSMFMKPFGTVQEAVDAALACQGPGAQVLFLTEASITVPRPRAVAPPEPRTPAAAPPARRGRARPR